MPETQLLNADERAEITRMFTEMKDAYKGLDTAIKKGEPTGDVRVKLDAIDQSLMDFHKNHEASIARLDAIDAKIAAHRAQNEPVKSVGERVTEDSSVAAALKSGGSGRFAVSLTGPFSNFGLQKDITGVSRGLAQILPVIAAPPIAPYGVRNLIPQGRTSAGAVSYVRETSFTNAAAPVAEGAAKPKSDKVFAPVTAPVETIAHYFKVSRQTYDDLPALAAMIDNQGIAMLKLKEDNQLLNGNGTPPNLQGFMPVAAAGPAGGSGNTIIDQLGLAVFDLASKGYMPDGAVVNPADWAAVVLKKNTLGNYLFANPLDFTGVTRIWGVSLVMSANMAAGSYLVGAFTGNSLLLDREEVNARTAEQNEDDFIKNMLTILIEERLVNLIFNVAAFEKGVIPAFAATEGEAEGSSRKNR